MTPYFEDWAQEIIQLAQKMKYIPQDIYSLVQLLDNLDRVSPLLEPCQSIEEDTIYVGIHGLLALLDYPDVAAAYRINANFESIRSAFDDDDDIDFTTFITKFQALKRSTYCEKRSPPDAVDIRNLAIVLRGIRTAFANKDIDEIRAILFHEPTT